MLNGFLRGQGNIQWQFFKDTKVISGILSEAKIKALKKAGYKISCVKWQWGDTIPDYILSDSTIRFIQFE